MVLVEIPYCARILKVVFPLFPFLVVTRITPLEPLDPYIAVAEASFRIDMYSISFAFIDAKSVEDIGTPSITYNGSDPAEMELVPRILIFAPAPGRPVAAAT